MKCPVCYTNIPLGETRCPNCGMIIKKDNNAIHSQYVKPIVNQANNKTNKYQKEIKELLNQSKQKTTTRTKPSKQKKSLIGGWNIILIVLFILFIIRVFIGIGINVIDYGETYYSFDDAIVEVEDDGTIEEVLNIKNNLEKGLYYYDYVNYNERVEVNDDYIIASATYDCGYDNCNIIVQIEASDAQINSFIIEYSGYYNGNPTSRDKPIQEETIDYIMDQLGYMNAYEDYQETRKDCINNDTNYHEVVYDYYKIIFSEYYDQDYNESSYQIMYIIG